MGREEGDRYLEVGVSEKEVGIEGWSRVHGQGMKTESS